METPKSLTEEEMLALGMDPQAPFATCPRTPDAQFYVRFGDDRIVRRRSGGVDVCIGYYSEQQQRARRLAGKLLFEKLQSTLPDWMKKTPN